MAKLARALVHERVVMALIVVNSVVLILLGYDGWRERTDDTLFMVDYALTAYFVGEMAIKIRLDGWRAFWSNGWNRFDLMIIAAGSPMLLVPFLDTQGLGVVLILRAVRIMRLLRGFRFIPDRDRIWAGIRRALRASVGMFLALIVYNVILGIGANALFGELAPAHFGDPLLAMYSMFKVFTIEGWVELPDLVASGASPAMAWLVRGYFVMSVLTGGILGLSIANAVFVDEMVIDNTDQVITHVSQLFERLHAAQASQSEAIQELQAKLDEIGRMGSLAEPRVDDGQEQA